MNEVGTVYRTNGRIVTVHPENGKKFMLEELQKFVGGSIELVPGTSKRGCPAAYMNEDGRSLNLPLNAEASRVFMVGRWLGETILGDVIQVRKVKP